jgi:hypothetical protein
MMARRGPLVAAQAEGLSREFWARLTKKTETDARDRISQVVRTVLCDTHAARRQRQVDGYALYMSVEQSTLASSEIM